MQINTATMIASQTTTTAPRSPDQSAEFAPLSFKRGSVTSAPAASSAQPQATTAKTDIVIPRHVMSAASESSSGSGYVRPGTHLDIKI